MRSSNPVLNRLGEAPRAGRAGYPGGAGYAPVSGYTVPGAPVSSRSMTIDDVVTRTIMLVVLTTVTAAISWFALTSAPAVAFGIIGASIAGLVLALAISFMRITNPLVISAYAVVQGVWLGVVSREFEHFYPGIVVQAVVGTFGVFLGMSVLYKFRVLRATPKFTRFVVGALIGVVVLGLVNLVLAMFGHNPGLVQYGIDSHAGPMAYIFSIACIAIGALTFILDFDQVEQGVRAGMPEKFAWYCAFGLLVGLIFLYWQILRLLGYARR